MPTLQGNILKMTSTYRDASTPVEYQLPIGEEKLEMNPLIGKSIKLEFSGKINCIATGAEIKKSYNNGYSYWAYKNLARCDLCIVKPELCHYHKGTCREPEWGEKHCFIPHIVYLSVSSHLKIGITRETQLPTRWIDQGAAYALPVLRVKDRRTSGLIESEIRGELSDRTNWRQMLKGELDEIDLYQMREQLYEDYGDIIDDLEGEDLDDDLTELIYPLGVAPPKLKSLNFDKSPTIEGELLGIKGQYLVFDFGVLNIRKFQGYSLNIHF